MPSGVPTSAGVHVEKIQLGIPHDFQNVGVAANEETGMCLMDDLARPRVVAARITANVSHIDTKAFTRPMKIFGELAANLRPVNVSVYTANWLELAQSLSRRKACMR